MSTLNLIARNTKKVLNQRCLSSISSKKHDYKLQTASDNIMKSPFRDLDIPNITIPEHIWKNLDKWADKPALVCGITNRSYTYHECYKYSRNFAARLRSKLGIRDRDVVCIMMPNQPEYGLAVLGALQAGTQVTTLNPTYTAHEVCKQLLLANPNVIIAVPEAVNVIKQAFLLAKKAIPIITVENTNEAIPTGTISFDELALNDGADLSVLNKVTQKSEDIALLPYSSGTTGLPKGVELINRNIVANLMQLDVNEVKHYSDTTSTNQDTTLNILPFYHSFGVTVMLLHKLSVGLKLITLPKFQPNLFLKATEEHRINVLFGAPPLVLFCGSHKDVTKEHMKHLKIMTSGAAPLPLHDMCRALEKCPPTMNFVQLYGLTETSPITTSMIPGEKYYTTSGYPLSNTELKVVDSEMRSLGPNEIGELLIKGPQVMKGYRNNLEATKGAITEDGWLKSGDLAQIDEKGAVTIVDRLKELIKVKGFQVPPAELESVVKEHPGVLDAAVVGIPDDKQGEAPKAFIVVKEGYNLKTDDITEFVNERVARYKRLTDVTFLDEIPKSPAGKILRRVLKEQYC